VKFTQYRYWDPVLGENAVRLSLYDRHGQEYFRIVPRERSAKGWRKVRDSILETLYMEIPEDLRPI